MMSLNYALCSGFRCKFMTIIQKSYTLQRNGFLVDLIISDLVKLKLFRPNKSKNHIKNVAK